MPSYRYQHGDRPLDGYTIEHACGRGGFGEVYYAISDAGRQVALKAVQNYEDIELRGISHCMNLKSPHLVSIFDVKYSDRGDPFVVMEFISGPSLRELLDDAPNGLGEEKAAWFIQEIARGLTLLHDNGVVHRDLKPHNVFYEDGYVKVGDYSLSKVITTSHRSGHTLTVGTVHYMAPEISIGRYDHTVDIYALGVLLYEMLTGAPPFTGESMGEVLMKHMSQDVDVSMLEEPFATVVKKAMAREPEQRYQSCEEFVAEMLGVDSVRHGVSAFSPASLTMVARRSAQQHHESPPPIERRARVSSATDATIDGRQTRPRRDVQSQSGRRPESAYYYLGQFVSRLGVATAARTYPLKHKPAPPDEISLPRRAGLAAGTLILVAITTSMLTEGAYDILWHNSRGAFAFNILIPLTLMTLFVWAAANVFNRMSGALPWFLHRIAFAAAAMVAILPFDSAHTGTPFAIAVAFSCLVLDWRWLTSPARVARVRLFPCFAATLIAGFGGIVTGGEFTVILGAMLAGGAALAVQTLSAFSSEASRRLSNSANLWEPIDKGLSAAYEEYPASVERAKTWSAQFTEQRHVESVEERSVENSTPLPPVGSQTNNASNNADQSDPSEAKSSIPGRTVALVLSILPILTVGFVPLCGLHRFYTGRFVTGFLWLFTLGLGGIGQLIDIVMISQGEFRDSKGRFLRTWRQTDADVELSGEQVNSLSVVPAAPSTWFSNGIAVIGGLTLCVDLVIWLALALDLPEMIQADLFAGLDLSGRDLDRLMGIPDWPGLLWEIGAVLGGVLAVGSGLLLITSRRRFGIVHMSRVIPAAAAFAGMFAFVYEGTRHIRWSEIVMALDTGKAGLVLKTLMGRNDFTPCMIGTAVLFSVAIFILDWPPKRTPPVVVSNTAAPTRQKQES